jgi:hypothetical protein
MARIDRRLFNSTASVVPFGPAARAAACYAGQRGRTKRACPTLQKYRTAFLSRGKGCRIYSSRLL